MSCVKMAAAQLDNYSCLSLFWQNFLNLPNLTTTAAILQVYMYYHGNFNVSFVFNCICYEYM